MYYILDFKVLFNFAGLFGFLNHGEVEGFCLMRLFISKCFYHLPQSEGENYSDLFKRCFV